MCAAHFQAFESPTLTMAPFDLPLRNRKDLARAAQLRNFAMVGRPSNPRSVLPADYDDPYLPISRRRPDRTLSNPYYTSLLPSYNSDQSTDTRSPDPYTYRPASYPRRTSADYTRLPFAQAARALHRALDGAYRHIDWLEEVFNKEMSTIPYADERARAYLWTLKVEYRGWNADVDAPPDINDRVDYFGKHAGRLLDAIEDMRNAERPSLGQEWRSGSEGRGDGGGLGYRGVTMEDVRFAMKKLGVSFGAVAELLEGIKVDKQRCAVLIRELRSAIEILKGIEEVWEMPRNGKGGFKDAAGVATADGRISMPVPVAFSDTWDGYSQT